MRTTTNTPSSLPVSSDDSRDSREVLPRGTRLGPWRIEHPLGAGGAGDVYSVVHEDIGKRAALKILRSRLSAGLTAERIRLEGQVVNRVTHPGIVDIFDGGTFRGRPYLVMEQLHGVTLATLMASTSIRPAFAVELLQQLVSVLQAAHAAGIVHRDLKPDNLFLLDTGAAVPQVKLIDWGIAKLIDDSSRRTMEGQLLGTPDYLSPEQACGRPVSTATDIYTLGVLAYELLCHHRPFEADSMMEILRMHLYAVPTAPRQHWREMPASLEQLLLAMLEKAPDDRPTLHAVARSLELAADELIRGSDPVCSPVGSATVAPPERCARGSDVRFAPTAPADVTLPASRTGMSRSRFSWPMTTVIAFALVASTSMFTAGHERRGHLSPTAAMLFDRSPPAESEAGGRPMIDFNELWRRYRLVDPDPPN